MTEEEKELAKNAVTASVNGLKDWILMNFYFAPAEKELVGVIAGHQIKEGLDDIDRISNPDHPANKAEKDVWFTEYNSHHPM